MRRHKQTGASGTPPPAPALSKCTRETAERDFGNSKSEEAVHERITKPLTITEVTSDTEPDIAPVAISPITAAMEQVDLFSCSLVFVPVYLGTHWCLGVVDMETKEIKYYDSMGGNTSRCLEALWIYLIEEHKVKKGSTLDKDEWETTLMKNIP